MSTYRIEDVEETIRMVISGYRKVSMYLRLKDCKKGRKELEELEKLKKLADFQMKLFLREVKGENNSKESPSDPV